MRRRGRKIGFERKVKMLWTDGRVVLESEQVQCCVGGETSHLECLQFVDGANGDFEIARLLR